MFSERLVPKNIERERSLCAGNELEEPQEGGAVYQHHCPSHQGQPRADVFVLNIKKTLRQNMKKF